MPTQSDKAARIKAQPISDPIVKAEYPTGNLYDIAAQLMAATKLEWSVVQVHTRAKTLGLHRLVDQRMFPPALGKPRPPKVIHIERAAICSDLHIPFHDRELLADLCRVAKRDKLTDLIIAGDLTDAAAFSKFDRDAPVCTWEQETKAAGAVIFELAQAFAHVHILPGNHDYRILKRLQGEMTWGNIVAGWDVMEVLGDNRPSVSDIPLVYLDEWGMVVHPDPYSRVPGNVAAQLAVLHQRDVFSGHEHALFQRFDVGGRYQCVGLGCMTRGDLTDYKTMHVTTHPTWNAGFVTIVDRQVTIYAKGRYKV